jgi:hypothetical protein
MPQTPAEPASNFAGLLAALTTPKASKPIFPLDDLEADPEPDIATLTYDRALRTHARYRPSQIPNSHSNTIPETISPPPVATTVPKAAPGKPAAVASESGSASAAGTLPRTAPSKLEQTRKRASITIRLTQSECAQLQQRAAEAGLTVSAYLRSCTIEVESLRAQVKQALAELRSSRPDNRPRRRIFSQLFSH